MIVPGAGPGHLFLPTGLVLGHLPHHRLRHQLEMASKTPPVKMSGKADSTSIRFLICHLRSHMYQQPKLIPVNWQEMKAGVDPTEEKGVPHPFLPSQGDLGLLFSTQAPELLLMLLSENCTASSPLPCPLHLWQAGRREGEVGICVCMCVCWGWGDPVKRSTSLLCVYSQSYCLLQL